MSFSMERDGDRVVVGIPPQLIIGNRKELRQRVLDELQRGARKFVLDFRQTGYVDSSGLGLLLAMAKEIREQSGELRLTNLNTDLRTLLELTRLDTLFLIDEGDGGGNIV